QRHPGHSRPRPAPEGTGRPGQPPQGTVRPGRGRRRAERRRRRATRPGRPANNGPVEAPGTVGTADVTELAAELYLVPPDRFVAVRDDVVRTARRAGYREVEIGRAHV